MPEDASPNPNLGRQGLVGDDAHGYWDPDEPHAIVTDPQHLKVAGRRSLSPQFDNTP